MREFFVLRKSPVRSRLKGSKRHRNAYLTLLIWYQQEYWRLKHQQSITLHLSTNGMPHLPSTIGSPNTLVRMAATVSAGARRTPGACCHAELVLLLLLLLLVLVLVEAAPSLLLAACVAMLRAHAVAALCSWSRDALEVLLKGSAWEQHATAVALLRHDDARRATDCRHR